jgi:putative phosphoesterase
VDEIWHAGDIGNIETADAIAAFKPLRAVYGNADGGLTRVAYNESEAWRCESVRVLMMHIAGTPGRYYPQAREMIRNVRPNLLIAGHSHILKVQFDKTNNLLYINPGAAGIYGIHKVRTAVRLTIDGANMRDLEVGEWSKTR